MHLDDTAREVTMATQMDSQEDQSTNWITETRRQLIVSFILRREGCDEVPLEHSYTSHAITIILYLFSNMSTSEPHLSIEFHIYVTDKHCVS